MLFNVHSIAIIIVIISILISILINVAIDQILTALHMRIVLKNNSTSTVDK